MGKDVLIIPPAAVLGDLPLGFDPSPEDLVQLYAENNRVLRDELEKVRAAASTITNVASSLVRLHADGDEAVVPRDVSDRMRGSRIFISENTDGDIVVQLRERQPDPIQIEGD